MEGGDGGSGREKETNWLPFANLGRLCPFPHSIRMCWPLRRFARYTAKCRAGWYEVPVATTSCSHSSNPIASTRRNPCIWETTLGNIREFYLDVSVRSDATPGCSVIQTVSTTESVQHFCEIDVGLVGANGLTSGLFGNVLHPRNSLAEPAPEVVASLLEYWINQEESAKHCIGFPIIADHRQFLARFQSQIVSDNQNSTPSIGSSKLQHIYRSIVNRLLNECASSEVNLQKLLNCASC